MCERINVMGQIKEHTTSRLTANYYNVVACKRHTWPSVCHTCVRLSGSSGSGKLDYGQLRRQQ